ncbi:MAG: beta-glucosidase [Spirochaetes bacterium]|nr:MAG: beta-glucosidase [Spirochaetota bacterium]
MNNIEKFPADFIWGTATASYQVEGAFDEDGRGLSIWDTFSKTKGKVLHSHNGDVACDQYHRYKDDVKLMKKLGIKSYRFSISWSRIYPKGFGEINNSGIEYYKNLCDELLGAGIEPCVTLYHWDLPQVLEDRGGWRNRETAQYFSEYAETVFRELGSRVKMWITLNEPFCSAMLGHATGEHAPGIKDINIAYKVLHNLYLAHGLAVKIFRDDQFEGEIGISLNLDRPRPASGSIEDKKAAEISEIKGARLYMDPLYGRGYPQWLFDNDSDFDPDIKEGDMQLIAQKLDFIGLNYYTEQAALFQNETNWKAQTTDIDKSEMGWDIIPEGLTRLLIWMSKNYNNPEIYVTENGGAFIDKLSEDKTSCIDPERVSYLDSHFSACKKAIDKGVNLKGYYLWSFLDNFEWAFGYTKRFGITYVDFVTLERIPKDSFYFYRDYISTNGLVGSKLVWSQLRCCSTMQPYLLAYASKGALS